MPAIWAFESQCIDRELRRGNDWCRFQRPVPKADLKLGNCTRKSKLFCCWWCIKENIFKCLGSCLVGRVILLLHFTGKSTLNIIASRDLLSGLIRMCYLFQIITPFRRLILCAENRKEMEDWISSLKSVQSREHYEVSWHPSWCNLFWLNRSSRTRNWSSEKRV